MMMMIKIKIEIETETEIARQEQIKRLRQTFDDKTKEIQARDHSPAWISR